MNIVGSVVDILCLVCILVFTCMYIYDKQKKIKEELKKSSKEIRTVLDSTMSVIKTTILSEMMDVEKDFKEYVKSGEIKKSKVIANVLKKYPVLKTFVNQEDIIKMISKYIEDSMPVLQKVLEENK